MVKSTPGFLKALFRLLSPGSRGGTPQQPGETQAILVDILEPLPVPLALLGSSGSLNYQNRAWREWTRECGGPAFAWETGTESSSTSPSAQGQTATGDAEVEGAIAQVVRGELTHGIHELCTQGTGGPRWVILEACRLELGGVILSMRDVSELRRLQLRLSQTEAELRRSQKVEELGRIAGGVAHDFNNLITIITSCCDLLLRGRLGDEARDLVGEIRKAADRASNLARRLVATGRSQEVSSTVLDLNRLVTDITRMMRPLIRDNIDVTTTLDHELGNVRIDAALMEQVVINLVLNARDAMPDGGKLMLATHKVVLEETQREQHPSIESGNYALLTVSDTGCGMTEEIKKHLFEPYFSTKEEGKGTGLGLSIVRGIIRQHGGHLEIASAEGQGSTFLVYLPEVESSSTRSPESEPYSESGRGARTIMLVEDVQSVRAAVRQLLQLSGHQVLEAVNGMEAIAKVERHAGRIDLLLTEMALAGMNGPEIAEILRLKNPNLRVLFLSGYGDENLVQSETSAPSLEVLVKPFDPDELIRRVRQALDQPFSPSPHGLGLQSPHGQTLANNGTRVQET